MKTFVTEIFFIILKDIYKTFSKLTKCDTLDIMEILGFGLVVNAIYGIYKLHDFKDVVLLLFVLYGTLKIKHFKKDKKC